MCSNLGGASNFQHRLVECSRPYITSSWRTSRCSRSPSTRRHRRTGRRRPPSSRPNWTACSCSWTARWAPQLKQTKCRRSSESMDNRIANNNFPSYYHLPGRSWLRRRWWRRGGRRGRLAPAAVVEPWCVDRLRERACRRRSAHPRITARSWRANGGWRIGFLKLGTEAGERGKAAAERREWREAPRFEASSRVGLQQGRCITNKETNGS